MNMKKFILLLCVLSLSFSSYAGNPKEDFISFFKGSTAPKFVDVVCNAANQPYTAYNDCQVNFSYDDDIFDTNDDGRFSEQKKTPQQIKKQHGFRFATLAGLFSFMDKCGYEMLFGSGVKAQSGPDRGSYHFVFQKKKSK